MFLYIGSISFGSIGAWAIFRWGSALGVLDSANHRSSHAGVVPKGGGIGILVAFVLSAIVLRLPVILWTTLSAVALFSFYGDKVEISPKMRLPIQFLAAFILLLFVFPILSPIFFDLRMQDSAMGVFLSTLNFQISILFLLFSVFLVGTANYYNFMDGINGIAGMTGIVAFGMIALFGFASGANETLVVLSVCMALACLGFLPFNMPKARVFMGDVGSILLGFLFASMVVAFSRNLVDFIVLCSFLFPFFADELTTEYVRIKDGENLFKPHRRHVYQLLANEMGIAHWKVTAGYGIFQALIGCITMAIHGYGTWPVLIFIAVCFIAFCIFSYHIRSRTENTI